VYGTKDRRARGVRALGDLDPAHERLQAFARAREDRERGTGGGSARESEGERAEFWELRAVCAPVCVPVCVPMCVCQELCVCQGRTPRARRRTHGGEGGEEEPAPRVPHGGQEPPLPLPLPRLPAAPPPPPPPPPPPRSIWTRARARRRIRGRVYGRMRRRSLGGDMLAARLTCDARLYARRTPPTAWGTRSMGMVAAWAGYGSSTGGAWSPRHLPLFHISGAGPGSISGSRLGGYVLSKSALWRAAASRRRG
jgi:hypothetical protein